ARRRRVRLRHRAAGGRGLHHDAQVPPEHLPGRRGDAGPGAAQALQGPARARRQLLLLRRRGSARDHGAARHPQVRRADRPRRPAGHAQGRRALEGQGTRLLAHLLPAADARGRRPPPLRDPGPRPGPRTRPQADRGGRAGARAAGAGELHQPDPQRQPHRRHHAVGGSGAPLRPRGAARRRHPHPVPGHRRAELRRLPGARHHARPGRRRQRLHRQGPVGRACHRAQPERLPRLRSRAHHRRQHGALWRDCRRGLLQRRGRRALRGATVRRQRGGRGHRRPRLRVHDQGHGGRARRHRPRRRSTRRSGISARPTSSCCAA
ncbi:MAG: hypothetical protein H6R03_583, partial [Burkholderiaceae bacterium]|nr:hypothetical protein [Burkholderiaceae bacterium]